jgi:nucleoside-diphosphate-sugar epimerase
MISYARLIVAAVLLLLAACENVVGFDYRVASKDPKVSSAQMLKVVTDALDRAEARAWAQIDEKTGEVIFSLGAFGSGKTPSIRNAETRILAALRYEFGEKVELFCNGEPLH